MLRYYASVGRAVWRQTLSLTPGRGDARRGGAGRLGATRAPSTTAITTSTTTAPRASATSLDRATGGRLSRDRSDRGHTFRAVGARRASPATGRMLVVVDLLLGRPADRRTDSLAGDVPAVGAARRDGRAASARRRSPSSPDGRVPPPGATWLGTLAFVIAGVVLALLVLVHRAQRAHRRPRCVLGLVGRSCGCWRRCRASPS